MDSNIRYPKVITYLRNKIQGTQWEGHLFVVGGCCRDLIMGRPIHDVDLTVDLPLGSIKFARWLRSRHLTIGAPLVFQRYSTARLRLKAFPDDELEIVQTRSDKYGSHNADNPAAAFGSLRDDCTRRDLTINSLYYDISADRMLDLCGMAIHDIEHHIIRTPAEPAQTFDDDPLRIVRCIRFACSLGWDIHPDTFEAMKMAPSSINVASRERIRNEFDKLLCCPDPAKALGLMEQCGAMAVVMPAIAPLFNMPENASNQGTVWQHTVRCVDAMARLTDDVILRMAALLCDSGKVLAYTRRSDDRVTYPRHDQRAAAIIDRTLRLLRYEPKNINEIIFLARNHTAAKKWGDKAEHLTDADLRRLQYICETRERFDRLLTLIHADNLSHTERPTLADQVPEIRRRAASLKKSGTEMFGYILPIQSPHIRRLLQIPPGRKVEQCKSYLLKCAFDCPRLNREKCRQLLQKEFSKRQNNR